MNDGSLCVQRLGVSSDFHSLIDFSGSPSLPGAHVYHWVRKESFYEGRIISGSVGLFTEVRSFLVLLGI